MKYEFRLRKVLEHRQRIEDEAKRNYMKAKSETEFALRNLKEMYQSIDDARTLQKTLNRSADLQQSSGFIEGQKIRIQKQRVVIREMKEEEERLQDLLVIAAREKKMLERLNEKSYRAFLAEVERLERKETDELIVMRYRRGEGP